MSSKWELPFALGVLGSLTVTVGRSPVERGPPSGVVVRTNIHKGGSGVLTLESWIDADLCTLMQTFLFHV